jgi:hypothetical protein
LACSEDVPLAVFAVDIRIRQRVVTKRLETGRSGHNDGGYVKTPEGDQVLKLIVATSAGVCG